MIEVHELGMCEAVLQAVERRAAGRQVDSIRLRVGTLHRVVPEAMDQAFELVAAGTVAEGATIDLVTVPARTSCRSCGEQAEVEEPDALCPPCGSTDVDLEGGDELTLESLELATAGSPSGPPG